MKTTAKSIILKASTTESLCMHAEYTHWYIMFTFCPTRLLKAHILQTYLLLNRNKTIKLIHIANHMKIITLKN